VISEIDIRDMHPCGLTRAEWIDRCARHLIDIGGAAVGYAYSTAKALVDDRDDECYTPEETADEEMSCWGE
jgi:hypothetical protein